MNSSPETILYAGSLRKDDQPNGATLRRSIETTFPSLTITVLDTKTQRYGQGLLRVQGAADDLSRFGEWICSEWANDSEVFTHFHFLVVSEFVAADLAEPAGALHCKQSSLYRWWSPPEFETEHFKPNPKTYRCRTPFLFKIGLGTCGSDSKADPSWLATNNVQIAESTVKLRLTLPRREDEATPAIDRGLSGRIAALNSRKLAVMEDGFRIRMNKLVLKDVFANLERELAEPKRLKDWRAERNRWIAKCYDAEQEFHHARLETESESAALDARLLERGVDLSRWAMYLSILAGGGVLYSSLSQGIEIVMAQPDRLELKNQLLGLLHVLVALTAGGVLILVLRDAYAILRRDKRR
jgi:hypothetical protein